MKVNICLSTYNGSVFLSDQIKSIQSQTFQDWTLLIRDDGSVDNTFKIIRDFEKSDPRIIFINPDHQKNIGFVASFFELLHASKADFYFFADQDDVWLPQKLEIMLDEVKSYDQDFPVLVYSNYKIVDDKLNVIHEKMLRPPLTHLIDELTLNSVNGWASMINHALAKLWTSCEGIDFHDWYLAELAAATGRLVYIDEITGLYRQHPENAVGANDQKTNETLKARFLETWLLIEKCRDRAQQVLSSAEGQLSLENQQILADFICLGEKKFWKRLFLVSKYKYRRVDLISSLKLRLMLVINIGHNNGNRNR